MNGNDFVLELENAGYFKYTNPEYIEPFKNRIKNDYEKYKHLNPAVEINDDFVDDGRMYLVDGEDLFEEDGFVYYINVLKPTFDKIGLVLNVSDENWNDECSEHTITINETEYKAYTENHDIPYLGQWDGATLFFMQIINEELKKIGSEERLYAMDFGGNEGRIFILTPELFQIIEKYVEPENIPITKLNGKLWSVEAAIKSYKGE